MTFEILKMKLKVQAYDEASVLVGRSLLLGRSDTGSHDTAKLASRSGKARRGSAKVRRANDGKITKRVFLLDCGKHHRLCH